MSDPAQVDGAKPDDWKLAARPLATSLRLYPERPFRVGMRSAMMDAATLCDLIAEQIEASGRTSKDRRAAAAVAKRCGDAIMAMRDQVSVSGDLTAVDGGAV